MKHQTLKPGEVCIFCGSVGKKAAKPGCPIYSKPFTRKTPWRLFHGKRVHIKCLNYAR